MKPLLELIPTGRQNAVSARRLAELLEVDPRAITKNIEALRKQGVAICGNASGFYRPVDAAELAEYVVRRQIRVKRICVGTAALKKTLVQMQEQEKPLSADCLATASTEGKSTTESGCDFIVPDAATLRNREVNGM